MPVPRRHRIRRRVSVVLAALILLPVPSIPSAAAARGAPAPDPVGVWPLRPEPEVVADFDPPSTPYGSGHRGVDLLGAAGQSVHAALPGQVTYAGPLAGKGVVVVSHGDTRTTYEPVAARVDVGDWVSAGARIGVLELPFSHCFPRSCLHWGWLRGDVYLDPLLLVGGGPVRLLPLHDPVPTPPAHRWPSPLPWWPTASRWRAERIRHPAAGPADQAGQAGQAGQARGCACR